MRSAAVLAAAGVLCGCAAMPVVPEHTAALEAQWQAHQRQVAAEDHWQARGRFGFVSAQGNAHGDFAWQVAGAQYTLRLSGPFGSAAEIAGRLDAPHAQITSGGTTQTAQVDTLLAQYLGGQLPVALADWARLLRGLSIAGATVTLAAPAYAAQISGADWSLEYVAYHTGTPALPHRLRLRSDTLRGSVVVREWSAP